MLFFAVVLFLIFGSNVVLGSMGSPQFLGDLGELLLVISAVIFFVIAIIQREFKEKVSADSDG